MAAVTQQQLIDAGTDCAHIAEMATSLAATCTDRLGHVKQTMSAASNSVAATSAGQATTARLAAEAAAVAAQLAAATAATAASTAANDARDGALVGANTYASEPLGRAAVSDGLSFKVQGAGDVAVFEYRRINSTTSALIGTYPSTAGINAKIQESVGVLGAGTAVAHVFEDAGGLVSAYVGLDGAWHHPATPGLDAAANNLNDKSDDAQWLFAVTDAADKITLGVKANGKVYADLELEPVQKSYADVHHIVLHGQSLAEGDEALPIVSSAATGWGSYRFGRGVRTWSASDNPITPTARATAGFGFSDLIADANGAFGETIANGLADGYKAAMGGRYSVNDASLVSPHVLVSYAGRGSTRLTQLNSEDTGRTDGRDTWAAPGGYWGTMLDDVLRAKTSAAALGKTHAVAGLVYMQGERDSDYKIYEWEAARTPSDHFATWRDKFKSMADAFDTGARAITGQLRRVPTFVYQTSNNIVGNAQLAAEAEHPDIYMVGPTYAVPSAINSSYTSGTQVWGNSIHLSADGARWYGEQCAKVMHRTLAQKENWRPLRPLAARKISSTQVDVDFHVPRPPLVVDTAFLAKCQNFGFAAYGGTLDARGTRCDVTAIEVLAGGTSLRLTFGTALPTGAFLSSGMFSTCDLGAVAVASTASASNSVAGFARFALTVTGDIRPLLKPLTDEGAFMLFSSVSQGVIREVQFSGGNTLLLGETRELRTGGSYRLFAAADALTFGRPFAYTNLRDSDNEGALNTVASSAYGTRAGQRYPLWNWCTFFDNFSIIGA